MKTAFLLIAFVLPNAAGATLEYPPEKIERLAESGQASWHGAVFAPSGMVREARTRLWKESDDHHVFFIFRDGKSYGEFRDEELSAGRFVRIVENYLIAKTRDVSKLSDSAKSIFVRREERLDWVEEQWIGSHVQWSFIWCSKEGDITRRETPFEERICRRNLLVQVNANLMRADVNYYLRLFRPEISEWEKAFGDHVFGERYHLGEYKVSGGRCSVRMDWPELRSKILIELHEEIPNSPDSPTAFILRTKKVGSMTVDASLLADDLLDFHPE